MTLRKRHSIGGRYNWNDTNKRYMRNEGYYQASGFSSLSDYWEGQGEIYRNGVTLISTVINVTILGTATVRIELEVEGTPILTTDVSATGVFEDTVAEIDSTPAETERISLTMQRIAGSGVVEVYTATKLEVDE